MIITLLWGTGLFLVAFTIFLHTMELEKLEKELEELKKLLEASKK
ncbi:hypothetical protein [Sulfurisphaera ohwakuensis]